MSYNHNAYSADIIRKDLQFYEEVTEHPYTLNADFKDRWGEHLVDLVVARLDTYCACMLTNTEIGAMPYDSNTTLRQKYDEYTTRQGGWWVTAEEAPVSVAINEEKEAEGFARATLALQAMEAEEEAKKTVVKKKRTKKEKPTPTVFKARFECSGDWTRVQKMAKKMKTPLLERQGRWVTEWTEPDGEVIQIPDAVVEFEANLTLDQVRDLMRRVEDAHVGVQTVQLKEDYTGERDWNL